MPEEKRRGRSRPSGETNGRACGLCMRALFISRFQMALATASAAEVAFMMLAGAMQSPRR